MSIPSSEVSRSVIRLITGYAQLIPVHLLVGDDRGDISEEVAAKV
jgi:hypothetical protein